MIDVQPFLNYHFGLRSRPFGGLFIGGSSEKTKDRNASDYGYHAPLGLLERHGGRALQAAYGIG